MDRQRTGLLLMSGAAAFGAFLPWVNAPMVGSVSGTAGADGWIVVVLAAIALVAGLMGDRSKPMSFEARVVCLLMGAGVGGIGLWKIFDDQNMKQSLVAQGGYTAALSTRVSVGTGLYVIVAAGVVMMLRAGMSQKPRS